MGDPPLSTITFPRKWIRLNRPLKKGFIGSLFLILMGEDPHYYSINLKFFKEYLSQALFFRTMNLFNKEV